ncbi:Rv1733c family protein [Streptomyces coffeae]|uniref:Uncharacterized protein n=1 Tax=Streptomyces coffeae TaxID=621382 RepID=A0ABS1NMM4_9ACTN|nr:hypothetical protein [Streptomyces coffeae]MBL1101152.1 hypothetical protein [Streptomyces coffeae]
MNTHGPRRAFGTHQPRLRAPARGRNPLRRRSDRIQTWCTVLFLLTLVCGLPAAALGAAHAAYGSQMRVVRAEEAGRHRITARLAETPPGGPRAADERSPRQARVRWTGADGGRHSGLTMVTGGTEAGDAVRVWVDRAGALVRAPASPSTARTVGWFTGCLTAAAVVTLACAARSRTRRALDRARYARWEAEWKVVEPAWSGRNRR